MKTAQGILIRWHNNKEIIVSTSGGDVCINVSQLDNHTLDLIIEVCMRSRRSH
jgi:hypothetical protein